MRSRFSAYACCNAAYIVKTTHPDNPDYNNDKKAWTTEIDSFCKNNKFLMLDILEFIDGESEAYVTFKAYLLEGFLVEKSRFLKVNGSWIYESGEFL